MICCMKFCLYCQDRGEKNLSTPLLRELKALDTLWGAPDKGGFNFCWYSGSGPLSYEECTDDETLGHFSPGPVSKQNVEKQLLGKLLTMNSSNSSHRLEGTKH